jgi:hypothetical protein
MLEGDKNDQDKDTTSVEYGNDIFDFSELGGQEMLEANDILFRGDIDPKFWNLRRQVEDSHMWGRVNYNNDIGKQSFDKIDQAIIGDISDRWAILLVHEDGPSIKENTTSNNNDDDDDDDKPKGPPVIDDHITEHRTMLQTQELCEYESMLMQTIFRCNSQEQCREEITLHLNRSKMRNDYILKDAITSVLRKTQEYVSKLPETSKVPIHGEIEERITGNGILSFIKQDAEKNLVEPITIKPERYRLWRYNLRNPKKVGWKSTPFTITCHSNAAPSLCLDKAEKNTCVVAVHESDFVVNVYKVDLVKNTTLFTKQVVLPPPFEYEDIVDDDNKESDGKPIHYQDATRYPPLFCNASSRGNQYVVGYGDGVFVIDDTDHVFHHRIEPPNAIFEHMITCASFGVPQGNLLYLGTRCGQIWMVNYMCKTPIDRRRPNFTFSMVLPIRSIVYVPHIEPTYKGKLCATTVQEVAYLDGPATNVRTIQHTGRAIKMDRPLCATMCGSLVYVLCKSGNVELENIDPDVEKPEYDNKTNKQMGMYLPATTSTCNTFRMVPWYSGIYVTPDTVYVMYPDGVIRVWYAMTAEEKFGTKQNKE